MDGYRVLTRRAAAEAHVLAGALRAEGFEVRLDRDGLGAIYGLTTGQFASRLLVAVEQYAAARDWLRAVDHGGEP